MGHPRTSEVGDELMAEAIVCEMIPSKDGRVGWKVRLRLGPLRAGIITLHGNTKQTGLEL